MENLFETYVLKGGIIMVPLLICSLLMVGGLIQGLLRMRRSRVMPPAIMKQARLVSGISARRSFVTGLRGQSSPLARAVWFTLRDWAAREDQPSLGELEAQIEEGTAQAADEMLDGLGLLGTIYTIAPLLGLLGTIMGLRKTFYEFAVTQEKSIEALSVGIQEALITTMWGLFIAIPAYIAVQWLQSIIRVYERERLPKATREVIALLYSEPEVAATPDVIGSGVAGSGVSVGAPAPSRAGSSV